MLSICPSFPGAFNSPGLRLHEDGADSCDFRFNPRWCLAGRPLEGEPLGHPGGNGEMVMLKQHALVVTHYTHYTIRGDLRMSSRFVKLSLSLVAF